ncbi:hypothetical protein TcCL_NonESM10633 [Trypanosoma cruzi]|nr:hypothetical protein TcCL_NonESM10633 [Trypanosoma cruzi]
MMQAAGRTARCLSLNMPPDPLRCHSTPRTAELPVEPHRTAACSLACTCRAECPATEHGLGHFPVPRLAAASQSPTRVPPATDSLSAMEALHLGLRQCLARGLPYRRQEVIMEGCPGEKGGRTPRDRRLSVWRGLYSWC